MPDIDLMPDEILKCVACGGTGVSSRGRPCVCRQYGSYSGPEKKVLITKLMSEAHDKGKIKLKRRRKR